MSEKDLVALEKAAYAAPWTVEYDSYRDDERWVVKADCTPVAFCDEKEEALTLAGMRNMLPELLSALTATRAELEQTRAELTRAQKAAGQMLDIVMELRKADGEQDTATTAHALERTTQTPNGLTWWARCTCGFPSVPTTSAYEAELKIAEHHERVKRATTCCEGTA